MDTSTSVQIIVEPSQSRLLKQSVVSGNTRHKCWICCLIAIASVTTVLFFKGESFLEMEFVKTSVLKFRSTIYSPVNFNESHEAQKYRVICMILTRASNWETKGKAVRNTWAQRCYKAIFFYTRIENCFSQPICNESNAVGLNVSDGRDHLTAKTLGALTYSYAKYGAEADYFLKADDDTYVITENLQQILSRFRSISLLYLGRLFHKRILPKGYNSGGAGYIISNQAAKLLVQNRTFYPSECRADGGYEDVEIGRCFAKFGIYPKDEMNLTGKQIFHDENPFRILQGDKGPSSYSYININGAEFGNKLAPRSHMLSSWTVTMHYVTPPEMYMYEFLLYHLKRVNTDEETRVHHVLPQGTNVTSAPQQT